jgi:hypothetical protein
MHCYTAADLIHIAAMHCYTAADLISASLTPQTAPQSRTPPIHIRCCPLALQLISSLPLESEGVVPQSYLKALYKHLKEAIREIAAAPSYAKGTAAAEKALVKSLDALCNRVGAMVRPDAKAYPEDYLQALFKVGRGVWARC